MGYRYLAYDLVTNELLDELPLVSPTLSGALNGAGPLQATMALRAEGQSAPGVYRSRAAELWAATTTGRTVVYVDSDGVLLPDAWILWTRRYDSDSGTVTLGGSSLLSYFEKRRIHTTQTFAGVDQLQIARDLVSWAQTQPGGDIGVQVGAELDGVLRDRTYWAHERKKVGEALRQLSAVSNGFDFAFEVAYDAGVPTRYLRVGTRGRSAETTGHVFEHGRNLIRYNLDEDASTQANRIYADGAGDGPTMLQRSADRTDVIDAGWPLLEDAIALKDVSVGTTLQGHATAQVDARAFPVTIASVTVQADGDPPIGSWVVGDYARFVFGSHPTIQDPIFPTRTELTYRIVGYTARPAERTVDLILN